MTRKINTAISFNKLCEESDDEDCYKDFYHFCGIIDSPVGSGSGSGSGYDDTERPSPITNIPFGTTSSTETRSSTDATTSLGTEDEMAKTTPPPTIPTDPFVLGPTTTESRKNVPLTQDGFDNLIPTYTKPNIANTKPDKPVDPPKVTYTDPTVTTHQTTEMDDTIGTSATTKGDVEIIESTMADGDNSKATTPSSTLEVSIQVHDTISSSAQIHVNRFLTSVLLYTCLCLLF